MKHAAIAAALLFTVMLASLARGGPGDDFRTEYFRKVSLFSPVSAHSTSELIQEGKTVFPPSCAIPDLFPCVPHGELQVPEGLRVMIFVPHPDDESIAAAGLIQRVLAEKGEVCVVFVTNGDGYMEAVRLKVKNARISARDFVEYGRRRQEEGTQALCELGLKPEDVVFLGFPDAGIDDLWESYWSNLKPFVSPYTLFDRPHRKGMNRWVKYSGVGLKQEMERVLQQFAPDWVVLPDPRDQHPDHSTAGVFVLDALRDIYESWEEDFSVSQVLTYLVHFRDYPHSMQWANLISASGVGGSKASWKTLANTRWVSLPLSAEEVEGKRRALLSHASQIQMLGGFFKNFLLPCELFGSLNIMQVIAVPQEYAAHCNHPFPPEED